jgi:hypothetical protein
MGADFPEGYLRQLERRVADAIHACVRQEEVVELLESKGMDATSERQLLTACENHVRELQTELDTARRLLRGDQ